MLGSNFFSKTSPFHYLISPILQQVQLLVIQNRNSFLGLFLFFIFDNFQSYNYYMLKRRRFSWTLNSDQNLSPKSNFIYNPKSNFFFQFLVSDQKPEIHRKAVRQLLTLSFQISINLQYYFASLICFFHSRLADTEKP